MPTREMKDNVRERGPEDLSSRTSIAEKDGLSTFGDLIAGLPHEERAIFLGHSSVHRVAEREPLAHTGNSLKGLFILLQGRASVRRTTCKARELEIDLLYPGDSVEGSSELCRHIVAREACVWAHLSQEIYNDLSSGLPTLWLNLFRSLQRRVERLSSKVFDFANADVTTRVLQELRRQSTVRKWGAGESLLSVSPKPTHAELAAQVGATRESVSRALALLEASKEVRYADGALILLEGDSPKSNS